MLLKEYFSKLEQSAFGPLLGRFKANFSDAQLELSYQKVNDQYLAKNGITITAELNIISNQALKVFKEFIVSESRETNYSHCRSLKKVKDLNAFINKFRNKEDYPQIKDSIESLEHNIDENSFVHYTISKKESFQNSIFKELYGELTAKIFHYVDGDIGGFNKDPEVVGFSGAEGVAQKLVVNSEQ